MSRLAIFDTTGVLQESTEEGEAISAQLGRLGVRFERWPTEHPLAADAGEDAVLAAYRVEVDALVTEYGFRSMDVVSIRPEHPQREELRAKFLDEHVHDDFEVRFFVDGSGLFYLHVDDRVYVVLCEKGDLISVPGGTPHWFDMGERPDFKCIRLFTIPDGWVAEPTGSAVGAHFPSLERFVEEFA